MFGLRMYCIDTGAIAFTSMFTKAALATQLYIHPIDTKIKGSILVFTNHINYEICIEYYVYLCSTSLSHTTQYPCMTNRSLNIKNSSFH